MGASGTYFSPLMPRVAIVFNGLGRDQKVEGPICLKILPNKACR